MSYMFNRTDATSFAEFINAETSEEFDELKFKFCPKCGGGRNADKDTFSINLKSGAFNCLRASCGYKGHFIELARDFDFKVENEQPKIYKKLPQPKQPIVPKNEAVKYLTSRGISESVCRKYEITVHKNMPFILVFPFFDENGKLQFIKYRNLNFKKGTSKYPKEWSEEDTMPILFGMKQCNSFDRLIITEGQIDSLSVAEAGFENAVSVPTGSRGFTWLTPCWDWIVKFKEVIVFGDYENGKITLLDTLKARLPMTVKAVRTQDYLGEKDANAILTSYGKSAIVKAIENAEVPKIKNVIDVSTIRHVNLNELDKIKTGIAEIDRVIGGLCVGQLILLTGKRGDGKSTLLNQFIDNALDENESVFAYSGELPDYMFKDWIDYQLAGAENIKETRNEYGDPAYEIPEEIVKKISEWYKGRLFLYDNSYLPDVKEEYESLTDTIESVIKQYGTKLICIDNLMTAMDFIGESKEIYRAQGKFAGDLKTIAMKYGVAIILIAHPRKGSGDFENDEVSGSSEITDRADVIMSYSRADVSDEVDGLLQITKNRIFGKLKKGKANAIRLLYSPKTKRVFSPKDKTVKVYGWQKEPKPVQETIKESAFLIEDGTDDDIPF